MENCMIFIIRNNNQNIIRRVLKKTVNLNEDFYRSAAATFIIIIQYRALFIV